MRRLLSSVLSVSIAMQLCLSGMEPLCVVSHASETEFFSEIPQNEIISGDEVEASGESGADTQTMADAEPEEASSQDEAVNGSEDGTQTVPSESTGADEMSGNSETGTDTQSVSGEETPDTSSQNEAENGSGEETQEVPSESTGADEMSGNSENGTDAQSVSGEDSTTDSENSMIPGDATTSPETPTNQDDSMTNPEDSVNTENFTANPEDPMNPENSTANPGDPMNPEEALTGSEDSTSPEDPLSDSDDSMNLLPTDSDDAMNSADTVESITYDNYVITEIEEPDQTEYDNEYKLALQAQLELFPATIKVKTGGIVTYVGQTSEDGDNAVMSENAGEDEKKYSDADADTEAYDGQYSVIDSVEEAEERELQVTWRCLQDYDKNTGRYEFEPVFPEEYSIADGVELPAIIVTAEHEGGRPAGGVISSPNNFKAPLLGKGSPRLRASANDRFYDGFKERVLPEIRDQGNEGCCWAFGNLAAIEGDLIRSGLADTGVDLSELHLAYYTAHPYDDPKDCHDGDSSTYVGSGSYMNNGGNSYIAGECLMNQVGPIEEIYMPYSYGNSYVPPSRYALSRNAVRIENEYYISVDDIEGIKAAIYEHGAVAASIWASESETEDEPQVKYSYTYNSFYGEHEGTNHLIALVGWDDDFPKENFTEGCKPPEDGAFLVRNSWGHDGYSFWGYFWLSYCDKSFRSSEEVLAYDVVTDLYDNCYAYDGGPFSERAIIPESAELKTTFEVDAGESIKAVAFELWSVEDNADITVTAGDRTAHAYMRTSYAGYYTAELDEELPISRDTTVTVTIQFSSDDGSDIHIPVEVNYDVRYGDIQQSYTSSSTFYLNGEEIDWDPRIKLFTDNTGELPVSEEATLSQDSFEGYFGDTLQLEFADDLGLACTDFDWRSLDEDVAVVDDNGRITVKYKKGSTIIEGSYRYGDDIVECRVTVKPHTITCVLDDQVEYLDDINCDFYPGKNGEYDYCHLPNTAYAAKTGYRITGWYTDNTFNNEMTEVLLRQTNTNLVLYPKWEKINLAVKFKKGSTTYDLTTADIDDMPFAIPTDSSEQTIDPNSVADEGYTFLYWSKDAAGEERINSLTAEVAFNLTRGNSGYTQNETFTVYPQYIGDVPVTGIEIDRSDFSLRRGRSTKLNAVIAPSNATNRNVIWSSSAPEVAAVDATGLVTANKIGTAVITVTAKEDYGEYSDRINITVTGNASDVDSQWYRQFSYTIDETKKTITITGYTGSESSAAIDATIVEGGVTYNTIIEQFNGGTLTSLIINEGVVIRNNNGAGTFAGNERLESIDMTGANTAGVKSFNNMFDGCTNLRAVCMDNLNAESVTSMTEMFKGCEKLTSVSFDRMDTRKVRNTYRMFKGCSSLEVLDLSGLDFERLGNGEEMFEACRCLRTIKAPKSIKKEVHVELPGIFYDGFKWFSELPYEVTYAVTLERYKGFVWSEERYYIPDEDMYVRAVVLSSYDGTDEAVTIPEAVSINGVLHAVIVGGFDCGAAKEISFEQGTVLDGSRSSFADNLSLTKIDFSGIDTDYLTGMNRMFYGCSNLKYINFGEGFDCTGVTSMTELFDGCSSLSEIITPVNVPVGIPGGRLPATFCDDLNRTYDELPRAAAEPVHLKKAVPADNSNTPDQSQNQGQGQNQGQEQSQNQGQDQNQGQPQNPSGAEESGNVQGQEFTKGANTYEILPGGQVAVEAVQNKKVKTVTIPATVKYGGKTYPVTRIRAKAFKNCKKLKKVKIGKNVSKIGNNAFYGCKNLTQITIRANKNLVVGKNAFAKIGAGAVITVKGLKGKALKKVIDRIKKQTGATVK